MGDGSYISLRGKVILPDALTVGVNGWFDRRIGRYRRI